MAFIGPISTYLFLTKKYEESLKAIIVILLNLSFHIAQNVIMLNFYLLEKIC